MIIRKASSADLEAVLSVERAAFGTDEEADLVRALMDDTSAEPVVSLLAFQGDDAVGHILFTSGRLDPKTPISLSILAPLAVVPDAQNQGIGGRLIEHGAGVLSRLGIDLVFVLGYPGYYRRHGFNAAGRLGFNAPFPIPERNADAWMVRTLRPLSENQLAWIPTLVF